MQGIFFTAIIQGASIIDDTTKYLPPKYQKYPSDKANNGKVVAVVVLGPPDTPHKYEDEGFYSPKSPKGSPAHMHRVLAYFKLVTPYQPCFKYPVSGGFHLLNEQDVYGLLYQMALKAKQQPGNLIFSNHNHKDYAPRNIYMMSPDRKAIDHALKYLEGKILKEKPVPTVKEAAYPARAELFNRDTTTSSIYRVLRKGGV